MIDANRTENYKSLLKIRQKGQKRNLYIVGGICLISLLATFGFGMIGHLNGRALFLALLIITLLAISYVVTWVRFVITNEILDLIDNLKS